MLRTLDVIINPSLRAWSETFCIANIEAMATGIPLVTFGIGGVGEYVYPPLQSDNRSYALGMRGGNADMRTLAGCDIGDVNHVCPRSSDHAPLLRYSVSENAVLVHEATPYAISDAVEHLYHNCSMRVGLGKSARNSITNYFVKRRQMAQYKRLYSEIFFGTCSPHNK